MDYFLYNGKISDDNVLGFMKLIKSEQCSEEVTFVLCTNGGDPNASFKMGQYLQLKYKKIIFFLPGKCKSAGTLLAISGHKIVFTPYGELGPLDVQIAMPDELFRKQSGLNLNAALAELQSQTIEEFVGLMFTIISNSRGTISFTTASQISCEFVSSKYKPIYARIDPEEVGSRVRSMNIGYEYANTLDGVSKNLRPGAAKNLSHGYPSHEFVISLSEAKRLFKNVDFANEVQQELAELLGLECRIPSDDSPNDPCLINLRTYEGKIQNKEKFTKIRELLKREQSNTNDESENPDASGRKPGSRKRESK